MAIMGSEGNGSSLPLHIIYSSLYMFTGKNFDIPLFFSEAFRNFAVNGQELQ